MASSHSQIIEHIVLFKVKENTEASEVDSMIRRVNGLRSLDQVLQISAGPIVRIRSPPSLAFNYILHSRYKSKEDLNAYAVHPDHVSVTKENARIVEDIMAVDWIADDLRGPLEVPPGSAVRVTILKLKEGLGEEPTSEILEAADGFGDQFTCGTNFSPGRAKGFSIVFLAIFKCQSDLEAADSNQQWVSFEDKFRDYLDSSLLLDYVVPQPQDSCPEHAGP